MENPQEPSSTSSAELLGRAITFWIRAQVVYVGHPRGATPEALALAEEVARCPKLEESVAALLAAPEQLVVAYALISLELMSSAKLASLPEALLERRSGIAVHTGCFRNKSTIGAFAKKRQWHARLRAPTREVLTQPVSDPPYS